MAALSHPCASRHRDILTKPPLEINDFSGIFVEGWAVVSSIIDMQADVENVLFYPRPTAQEVVLY